MPKPLGIIDVLVSRKPPEHGLPQHADQRMTAVLAGPSVSENLACHHAEAERVVEFPVREQTGVGGNATDPRKWSIRRRSKSSLRTSSFDSPAEFGIAASLDPG